MHARIAYSMRIMLDHLKDEILNHSDDSQSKSEVSDTCYCKELKKCKACKDKKHAAKAALHSQRKEDKKLFKLNKRKVLSESSDTDNEVQSIVKQKSMTSSMTESKMVAKQQFTCSGSSSVSEDYNMAASMLSMKQDDPNDGAKIINSSTKTDTKDEEGAVMVANPTEVKLVAKENGKQDASAVECEFAGAYTVSRSQSNPSDSEFEVISLPPNANTTSYYSTTGIR